MVAGCALDVGVVPPPEGTVVGAAVVVTGCSVDGGVDVVGVVAQSEAVVTYGAATRPRASPLPVKTALMSICPQRVWLRQRARWSPQPG